MDPDKIEGDFPYFVTVSLSSSPSGSSLSTAQEVAPTHLLHHQCPSACRLAEPLQPAGGPQVDGTSMLPWVTSGGASRFVANDVLLVAWLPARDATIVSPVRRRAEAQPATGPFS